MDYKLFFLRRKSTSLKIRPQVIDPAKATALATSLQPSISSNITPTTLAIFEHVVHELVIFLWRPQALSKLVAIAVAVAVTVAVIFRLSHFTRHTFWISIYLEEVF